MGVCLSAPTAALRRAETHSGRFSPPTEKRYERFETRACRYGQQDSTRSACFARVAFRVHLHLRRFRRRGRNGVRCAARLFRACRLRLHAGSDYCRRRYRFQLPSENGACKNRQTRRARAGGYMGAEHLFLLGVSPRQRLRRISRRLLSRHQHGGRYAARHNILPAHARNHHRGRAHCGVCGVFRAGHRLPHSDNQARHHLYLLHPRAQRAQTRAQKGVAYGQTARALHNRFQRRRGRRRVSVCRRGGRRPDVLAQQTPFRQGRGRLRPALSQFLRTGGGRFALFRRQGSRLRRQILVPQACP